MEVSVPETAANATQKKVHVGTEMQSPHLYIIVCDATIEGKKKTRL